MINCENFSTAANMKKNGQNWWCCVYVHRAPPFKKKEECTASFLLFPGLFFIDVKKIIILFSSFVYLDIFYAIVMGL